MAASDRRTSSALWTRIAGQGLYFWLRLLLVLLLLIQVARLIWAVVTPLEPLGNWRAVGADLMAPSARAGLFASFDPFDRGAAVAAGGDAAVTSLDLTLYGLRMNEASGQGSAIIAGSDGIQRSISVGEEIMPGVTLVEVNFDNVVISRSGTRESLFLDQSVPADTVGGDEMAMTAPAQPSGAAPLSLTAEAITAGINFAPRTENGRVTGIAVTGKGDSGIFEAAGFRAGDIVTQIDGQAVSGASDMATLLQKIRPGARLSLMVERGADVLPIAIIVPEQ